MKKLYKYRVLMCGILSPLAAIVLYLLVYNFLSARSANLEKDWLFRLTASTLSMLAPFLLTVVLAVKDRHHDGLMLSGKIGVAIAFLSLGLALKPVSDGMIRWKQSHNQAMQNVPAPLFETVDLNGTAQRLGDQKGKVVVVNLWATWCGPCREEMPKLDRLYQQDQSRGLMVFGLSDEDKASQQKFVEKVPVTYPLLTLSSGVPEFYRDIVRYPAIFLIDRQGRLQPAPSPSQPFEQLQASVENLLGPSR